MPLKTMNFPASRPLHQLLFLLSGIVLVLLWSHLDKPDMIIRTTPPPELGIELSEEQLSELASAYESGFDHPDPKKDDPCKRLQLLPYKKLSTWRKQFRKRGFTMEKIKHILQYGRREAYTHPEKAVPYTKIFDEQGNWIVVDFIDCIIWQVAPYNFK